MVRPRINVFARPLSSPFDIPSSYRQPDYCVWGWDRKDPHNRCKGSYPWPYSPDKRKRHCVMIVAIIGKNEKTCLDIFKEKAVSNGSKGREL